MDKITSEELIKIAMETRNPKKLLHHNFTGTVGCALITNKNNVYLGVNLDLACGIGFCAEHSAIASMITNKEFIIKKIVSVGKKNEILPPCGRCRELLFQVSKENLKTKIILGNKKEVTLKKLLPVLWE